MVFELLSNIPVRVVDTIIDASPRASPDLSWS